MMGEPERDLFSELCMSSCKEEDEERDEESDDADDGAEAQECSDRIRCVLGEIRFWEYLVQVLFETFYAHSSLSSCRWSMRMADRLRTSILYTPPHYELCPSVQIGKFNWMWTALVVAAT